METFTPVLKKNSNKTNRKQNPQNSTLSSQTNTRFFLWQCSYSGHLQLKCYWKSDRKIELKITLTELWRQKCFFWKRKHVNLFPSNWIKLMFHYLYIFLLLAVLWSWVIFLKFTVTWKDVFLLLLWVIVQVYREEFSCQLLSLLFCPLNLLLNIVTLNDENQIERI